MHIALGGPGAHIARSNMVRIFFPPDFSRFFFFGFVLNIRRKLPALPISSKVASLVKVKTFNGEYIKLLLKKGIYKQITCIISTYFLICTCINLMSASILRFAGFGFKLNKKETHFKKVKKNNKQRAT